MSESNKDTIGRMVKIVAYVRNLLSVCDPVFVLAACNKISAQAFVCTDKGPISRVSSEPGLARAGEYLQSIFVADEKIEDGVRRSLNSDELGNLLGAVIELYNLSFRIQIDFQEIFKDELTGLTAKQENAITTCQLMYGVRGRRDYSFQREYHEFLIAPHDDVLRKIYGIGADRVVEGLLDLMRVLMKGWFDYYEFKFDKPINKEFFNPTALPTEPALSSMFDVVRITGWPEPLIKDLSKSLGDGDPFLRGKLAGSPIRDYPVKDKPFLAYRGKFYAFNYYLLSDYFYRSLHKALERQIVSRNVKYDWAAVQCTASETKAFQMFARIFPEGNIFCNNKYRPNGRNSEGENDLLVVFGGVAVIVEVKGKRRWHDSPALKAKAIINRNFSDIKEAIEQCRKVEAYMCKGEASLFYTNEWKLKFEVEAGRCARFFKIVLAVDGANEIMSNVAALEGFVGDQRDVACLSIEDFMVYSDIFFRKPFQFLCYLAQRLQATHVESLMAVDELDYLSSYLNNPWYVDFALDFEKQQPAHVRPIISTGSFQELDSYFAARNNPTKEFPQTDMFPLGRQTAGILAVLQRQEASWSMEVAELLLNQSEKEKCALEDSIENGLARLRFMGIDCVSFDIRMLPCKMLTVFVAEERNPDGNRLKQLVLEARRRIYSKGVKCSYILILKYHGALDSIEYLVEGKD